MREPINTPVQPIFYLIYTSKAKALMADPALLFLLEQSRRNNADDGITGMLLYMEGRFLDRLEGRFIQLLEGEEEAVRNMFAQIKADERHHGILILRTGNCSTRTFPDWSMGFRLADTDTGKKIAGFFQLDLSFAAGTTLPEPKGLLKYFRSFYEINKLY